MRHFSPILIYTFCGLATHLINLIDKSYTFSQQFCMRRNVTQNCDSCMFHLVVPFLLDTKIYDQFKLIHEPMCGCCLFIRTFQKLFFRVLNYVCGAHHTYKIIAFWHYCLVESNLLCKCIISSSCRVCFFLFFFLLKYANEAQTNVRR